jgi:hypothetical protein
MRLVNVAVDIMESSCCLCYIYIDYDCHIPYFLSLFGNHLVFLTVLGVLIYMFFGFYFYLCIVNYMVRIVTTDASFAPRPCLTGCRSLQVAWCSGATNLTLFPIGCLRARCEVSVHRQVSRKGFSPQPDLSGEILADFIPATKCRYIYIHTTPWCN